MGTELYRLTEAPISPGHQKEQEAPDITKVMKNMKSQAENLSAPKELKARKDSKTLLALLGLALFTGLAFTAPAMAEVQIIEINIKDHKFDPDEIEIPAGTKVKLVVNNLDPTPEEFESFELNREKIIVGGGKAIIFIGPLDPGRYHFFGEFNMDSANGYIVVK